MAASERGRKSADACEWSDTMSIDILERYKLIFAEHHYASDIRVKIVTGWCLMYAGLAAAFTWVHSESKPLAWIITAAGVIITVFMWLADC